jgi:hypothetical protein
MPYLFSSNGIPLETTQGLVPVRLKRTAAALRFRTFAGLCFGEPSVPEPFRRNTGQIQLDVENGCAVEHIQTAHPQGRPLPAQQLDDRQSDGIRPARRTGGEHAVRTIIKTARTTRKPK